MEYHNMKKLVCQKSNKKIENNHISISNNLKKRIETESDLPISGRRGGLLERFSSLGYIHNSTDVIQPKLICTYAGYAEIHNLENARDTMTRYVQYMLKPELPVLWEMITVCNRKSQGEDDRDANDCYEITEQLSKIPDRINTQDSQRLQEISQYLNELSAKIMDWEMWMERKYPEDYKNAESKYLYMGNSNVNQDIVKTQTRGIFSRSLPNCQLTEEHLNGGDAYLHSIATLTFTEFRQIFSDLPGLLNIMNHIHESWKLGQVVDRRSEDKKAVRANTPDDVGGIRCIHTDSNPGNRIEGNTSYRLSRNHSPELPTGGPQTYHAYVVNKAIYGDDNRKNPIEIDAAVRESGKFLVEYSGVPFGGEPKPHNNKIVFNYLTGDIYVTFNHYRVMMKVDMEN